MHFNVAQEVIETCKQIFANKLSASKTIAHRARLHKKWGARDRKLHAEQSYELIRNIRYWNYRATQDIGDFDVSSLNDSTLWAAWAALYFDSHKELPNFDTIQYVNIESLTNTPPIENISPAIQYGVPDWLYQKIHDHYQDNTTEVLRVLNTPASVFLRANTQKTTLESLHSDLSKHQIPYKLREHDAIEILDRNNLASSNLIQDGLVEVQDLSSQLVSHFIDPKVGSRIIDACAGAGGKSLHLSNLMAGKGQIIALDNYEKRLIQLKKRARRNDVHNIEIRKIENSKSIKKLRNSADVLLLDVPCSGSGVWRRKPESKWFLNEKSLDNLILTQRELLSQYHSMTKLGGLLIYATCSILPEENRYQIDHFLEQYGENWELIDELVIHPTIDSGDGFYAAKLRNTQDT